MCPLIVILAIFLVYISMGKGNKSKSKQMRLCQMKKILHVKEITRK